MIYIRQNVNVEAVPGAAKIGERMYRCTPLILAGDAPVLRQSVRPVEWRPPGYDDEFDATTLFYDVIAAKAPHGKSLLLVGPPLLNLLPSLHAATINGRPLASTRASYYLRHRCSDVWIPGWTGDAVELEIDGRPVRATPQPSANALYAGRRVLYTLSKDNDIAWIIDWVTFHIANHGADAVLIYDNASSTYSGYALEERLRQVFPAININVVDWPYKYGPQGVTEQSGWDSDFCQAAAFQDARFRFLASASSVLNCDIDELVVSERGASIFEATEASASGCTMFSGVWVSNVRSDAGVGSASATPLRHAQFVHAERIQPHACPTKWCVVPGRCRPDDQWITHVVLGMDELSSRTSAFSYRHFRGISTNWKYQRTWPAAFDARVHRVDDALERSFAAAKMRRKPGPLQRFRRRLERASKREQAREVNS